MINSRLFEWYGINTEKNLGIEKRCPRPFDTVLIDKQGSCYLCECTAWLPQSVGNLQLQDLKDILESGMTDVLRTAITDGSYRYCNEKQCSYLLDARQGVPWNRRTPVARIQHLRLAIDDSCNLSCPSCRVRHIFHRSGSMLRSRLKLADRIIDFLRSQNHPIQVHIGSDGDPFASLVYRHFMRSAESLDRVSYSIQTNGLLIEQMHPRVKHIFSRLHTLNISIDGASADTYEQLRKGGSWKKILQNLAYVKKIKGDLGFKLILHFVVQRDNYHEMPNMIELAQAHGADKIWFNRITNWNTFPQFESVDIMSPNHSEHHRYQTVLSRVRQIADNHPEGFVEMPTLVLKDFK